MLVNQFEYLRVSPDIQVLTDIGVGTGGGGGGNIVRKDKVGVAQTTLGYCCLGVPLLELSM